MRQVLERTQPGVLSCIGAEQGLGSVNCMYLHENMTICAIMLLLMLSAAAGNSLKLKLLLLFNFEQTGQGQSLAIWQLVHRIYGALGAVPFEGQAN